METAILIVGILTLAAALASLLFARGKKRETGDGADLVSSATELLRDKIEGEARLVREANKDNLNNLTTSLAELTRANNALLISRIESMEKLVTELTNGNDKRMSDLKAEMGRQLTEMRGIVDEKLSKTLDDRLTKSFELINQRLESVYKGLGEMQSLASGVSDLKKVLTNVKTRGVWGEVSLGNLLEQMLAKEQYVEFGDVADGSQKRVDFAVVLPGKSDGEKVLLPIDAKFPTEDYQRLVEASEKGDAELVRQASKALEDSIKRSAKSIRDKYVNPPKTTDFAIMYLATEGLYAEVAKNPALLESLQNNYKIVPAGPVNLAAMLNSLQMGFRTLAIEKRSVEVWNILAAFKKEFFNFNRLLEKTQVQLGRVSGTIERATKRTTMIQKKLKDVQLVEGETAETENLFPDDLLSDESAETDDEE